MGKFIFSEQQKSLLKKIGQFVTLWKRDSTNITVPMDVNDGFDFVLILCHHDKRTGRFLFPKEALLKYGILTNPKNAKHGKRGFRVYPCWDVPQSKQAIKNSSLAE